jgi:hypothetical protein
MKRFGRCEAHLEVVTDKLMRINEEYDGEEKKRKRIPVT